MKRIHIFRTGRHTSAAGTTLDFSDDAVRQAAEAYDPKLHEAPIVVGHPKDNGPAFGWISGLEYQEGNLDAVPSQVNADFAELVQKGTYKKVSASFYAPDAPSNPKPGAYYLRHVGFLGAMPPAIKGLEGVQFSEDEEGVVEFAAEWESAGIFRRLREFLIEKFGVEEADKAIPSYLVESAEDAARRPMPTKDEANAAYTESEGDDLMTPEELKAAQDQIKADQDALKRMQEEFAEEQRRDAEARAAERRAANNARVDKLVGEGKILPAQADGIKSFLEQIDADGTVEFGEGDAARKLTAVEFFFDHVASRAQGPDFGEHSAGSEGDTTSLSAEEVAVKAQEYREERAKAGTKISFTEAVAAVVKKHQ
jgi:hypothetical protein